ncbi:hypothetical protein GYMLUDRAFT_247552 [Collybiopsis luxurians FD-317 M1]|uniref:Unplaced genomic scaffold GYMLUscaffold_47, whole genome shotgun sequence n=1 Tax=Collybiopsis luxurians FD-317 M1 TaxID=944289 RepID=A0A0D0BNZ2_9AGAR|nr:hypothetical protein GYMLUDRAFT_247552 [Collybiopsis luxurians FD-317 M1]
MAEVLDSGRWRLLIKARVQAEHQTPSHLRLQGSKIRVIYTHIYAVPNTAQIHSLVNTNGKESGRASEVKISNICSKQWAGYDDPADNSWESEEALSRNCQRLLASFWREVGRDDKDYVVGQQLTASKGWIASEIALFADCISNWPKKRKIGPVPIETTELPQTSGSPVKRPRIHQSKDPSDYPEQVTLSIESAPPIQEGQHEGDTAALNAQDLPRRPMLPSPLVVQSPELLTAHSISTHPGTSSDDPHAGSFLATDYQVPVPRSFGDLLSFVHLIQDGENLVLLSMDEPNAGESADGNATSETHIPSESTSTPSFEDMHLEEEDDLDLVYPVELGAEGNVDGNATTVAHSQVTPSGNMSVEQYT